MLETCQEGGKEGEGGRKGRREEAVERRGWENWRGRAQSAYRPSCSHATFLWLYFCLTFLKTKLALPEGRVPQQQDGGMAKASGPHTLTFSPSSR